MIQNFQNAWNGGINDSSRSYTLKQHTKLQRIIQIHRKAKSKMKTNLRTKTEKK